jgi:SAM-dependent methyltransferase
LKSVEYQTHGLDVEVYDQRFEEGDPLLEGDVDFYLEYAKRYGCKGSGTTLELGCGTGRITWVLASNACDALGIDLSSLMVKQAQGKATSMPEGAGQHVHFQEGDMTHFDLGKKFPLIIVPGRTFQCLTSPDQQKASLTLMSQHLEKNGRLILDLFDPQFGAVSDDQLAEDEDNLPIVKHPKTGNLVKIDFVERESDMLMQTFEDTYVYTEMTYTGQVLREEEAKLKMRWATRQEMRYLFELCGLEVEDEFSDFKKSPPVYGQDQIWVLKKK